MDFMNMFQDMQQKMEEARNALAATEITEQSGEGQVRVTITGDKKVKQILISPEFLAENDAEALEDLLLVALNRANEKADKVAAESMKKVSGGILPGGLPGGLPGLFG